MTGVSQWYRYAGCPCGATGLIEIADHGRGLPEGSEQQVFDKFFRASSAPGVGLGLAVVRGLVEAHGGTIVAGNRPGGGALFTIALPAATPPPPAPGTELGYRATPP